MMKVVQVLQEPEELRVAKKNTGGIKKVFKRSKRVLKTWVKILCRVVFKPFLLLPLHRIRLHPQR